jgi:hypothetical protein
MDEFRDLVKALHRAGIEVILDVVYNHTAEGNADGPTLCYRGLANEVDYVLENDRARSANYSGTGNTLDVAGAAGAWNAIPRRAALCRCPVRANRRRFHATVKDAGNTPSPPVDIWLTELA